MSYFAPFLSYHGEFVKLLLLIVGASVYLPCSGWTLNYGPWNLAWKKLEALLYRVVHNIFWYTELFRRGSPVSQMDGQMDGITLVCLIMCTNERINI